MSRTLVFTPEAEAYLLDLYHYIAAAGSPNVAARYTDAIVSYCESLQNFPNVGTSRDDICDGLRVVSFKKRVVIAFTFDAKRVSIIGIFYGGRDYESLLDITGDA